MASYSLAWLSGIFDLEINLGFDSWRLGIHIAKLKICKGKNWQSGMQGNSLNNQGCELVLNFTFQIRVSYQERYVTEPAILSQLYIYNFDKVFVVHSGTFIRTPASPA
jgi:hypothetical protein